MLKRVVNRACKQLEVEDVQGETHYIKLDNFDGSSQRTMRADRQVITPADTELLPGAILKFDGFCLILARQDPDYYRGKLIRYTFEAVKTTHTVNVIRTTLQKNDRGGLAGKTDVVVKTGLVGKVTVRENTADQNLDTYKTQFVMLVSAVENVQIEDRLMLGDADMEAVKVESVVKVTAGLKELWFDRDPRWL